MKIDIDLIKQLREKTSLSVMDCKKALEESGCDMKKAMAVLERRGVEISEKKKDLTKLLDNPRILKLVKEKILPILSEWQKNLYVMFQIFKVMNQVGDFIKKLQPDDKPSEKLKEYLKTLKVDEKTIMLETNN